MQVQGCSYHLQQRDQARLPMGDNIYNEIWKEERIVWRAELGWQERTFQEAHHVDRAPEVGKSRLCLEEAVL